MDSSLSANIFSLFKTDFDLTEFDQIILVESHTDKIGLMHSTYSQSYKNIPVEKSMIVTHGQEFQIDKINGSYAKNLDIDVTPSIDEMSALAIALESLGAEKYAWEDSLMENFLKIDSEDDHATYFPTGSLLIAKDFLLNDSIYKLSWKFEILTISPDYKAYDVYIDAHSGEILQIFNHGMFCDGVVGSGSTFYGTQNFDARHRWVITNVFTLEDCDRGDGIYTKKYDGSGDIEWSNTVQSHGHGPSPSEGWWGTSETEAITAHWIAQQTYDCFQDNFDRNNFDGTNGRELRIITEADGMVAGSDYKIDPDVPSYLAFGYHGTGPAMERNDVVGHEWTHLFSTHELLWSFTSEPQAINESISDIFGNYVEAYITGDPYDYILGEDVTTDRSMSNPPAFGDPDMFDDIDWFDVSGVNSGPFNKMFYLLADGDTHPVSGVTVTAIGIEDAMQIMYKVVEDHYITGSATYSTARTGCINAAKDLFGDCSVQARQVARAFGAIGVGSPTHNSIGCVTITNVSPIAQCEEDINEQDLVFTTQFLPSTATVVWTIPSGWTASYSGAGNSICTITHVTDGSTKTITASVTTVKGSASDSYEYEFQDCDEDGCPPECRFEFEDLEYGENYFIYPNPSNTSLTIYSKQSQHKPAFKIYNSQGTTVLDGEILNENYSVDISNLPNGFYILHIQYNNTKELFKLIIE